LVKLIPTIWKEVILSGSGYLCVGLERIEMDREREFPAVCEEIVKGSGEWVR